MLSITIYKLEPVARLYSRICYIPSFLKKAILKSLCLNFTKVFMFLSKTILILRSVLRAKHAFVSIKQCLLDCIGHFRREYIPFVGIHPIKYVYIYYNK